MYTESSLNLKAIPGDKLPPTNQYYNQGLVPKSNEFRWTVRLLVTGSNSNMSTVCSGSIIGPKTIVTAGSCVYNATTKQYMNQVIVQFNLSSYPFIVGPSASNNVPIKINTMSVLVHPEYVSNADSIEHNLALVYMPRSIDFRMDRYRFFNTSIALLEQFPLKPYDPVAAKYLPRIDADGSDGHLELSGFGASNKYNLTFNSMRHYRVYMTSLVDCLYIFNANICRPGIITTRNLFFPIANGCSVEMGAPLSLSAKFNHYGQFPSSTLVGIFTFGSVSPQSGACSGKYLSGFVSIPFNFQWLTQHII